MTQIATTEAQSRRLLEAGIDPQTADMYYKNNLSWLIDKEPQYSAVPSAGSPVNALEWYNKGYTASGKKPLPLLHFCFPAWSLSALWDLLAESNITLEYATNRSSDALIESLVTAIERFAKQGRI